MKPGIFQNAPGHEDVDQLVGELVRCWTARSATGIAALYASEAVLIYAGRACMTGAQIGEWLDAALSARTDIEMEIRVRAYSPPILCVEYVTRFRNASGERTVLGGAEVLRLASGPDNEGALIVEQHIYPALLEETSPLLNRPPIVPWTRMQEVPAR